MNHGRWTSGRRRRTSGGGGGRSRGGRTGRHGAAGGRSNRGELGGSRWNSQVLDVIEEIGTRSTDPAQGSTISVAIEGCCHGKLDQIYERLFLRPSDNNNNNNNNKDNEERNIDLLLCCGDFQSLRTPADFHSLAVPPKYRELGSFWRYYSGQKVAPVLTVFIGGNHEASQPLQELYYGGWVAPNIYYLGAAGVITFRGIRIGGLSGIYKSHDYLHSRWEVPPYDQSSLRSIYHYRNVEVYRLRCLATAAASTDTDHNKRLAIMISHDWPQGVEQYGDVDGLIRRKPFFQQEIANNCLGSPPAAELLHALQPVYWFAAHLHVKFQATVQHYGTDKNMAAAATQGKPAAAAAAAANMLIPSQAIKRSPVKPTAVALAATTESTSKEVVGINTAADEQIDCGKIESDAKGVSQVQVKSADKESSTQFVAPESTACGRTQKPDLTDLMTRFLSLDKCLPRRQYLSIVHIPVDNNEHPSDSKLKYDLEWLAVLRKTHNMSSASHKVRVHVPRIIEHAVTEAEMEWVRERLGGNLTIPEDFEATVPPHVEPAPGQQQQQRQQHPRMPPPLPRMGNPQTDRLLQLLDLTHHPNLTIPYTAAFSSQPYQQMGPNEVACIAAVDDENEGDLHTTDEDAAVIDEDEIDLDAAHDETVGSQNEDCSSQELKKQRLDDGA